MCELDLNKILIRLCLKYIYETMPPYESHWLVLDTKVNQIYN